MDQSETVSQGYMQVGITMKRAILLAFVYSLFFSSQVYAWTKNAHFEDGTVGDKAKGATAFDGAPQYTVYSNKFVHSGKLAAEMGIDGGSTGFGDWGGKIDFPTELGEGDEVWLRAYLYFPTGFDFSATGQGLKTQRIHVKNPDGSNQGYIGTLIDNGITVASEVGNPEFKPNNPNSDQLGTPVPRGAWHAIEQYIKFSATPGKAVYRVWQNGKLIFEDTATHTLRSSTSKSDFMYLFTYWNGGAPKTQKAYVDDLVVTSDRPSNTDAHGNHFIGIGDVEIVAAPAPPFLLK